MSDTITGMDAKPAASCSCRFELKEFKTVFTCQVCKLDSYDIKRYHCNHCGKDRHEGCVRLADEIEVGPGPNNIFGSKPVFDLVKYPKQDKYSKNKLWAKNCVVCGMKIEHYSYHAQTTQYEDLNMHPCCAELATSGGQVPLELQTGEKQKCMVCGETRPPGASLNGPTNFYCWSYILTEKKHRIHVKCFREMVIEASKSMDYDDDDGKPDNKLCIVLKHRRDKDNNVWEAISKGVVEIALEASGIGFTQIILDWLIV